MSADKTPESSKVREVKALCWSSAGSEVNPFPPASWIDESMKISICAKVN